jgi:hypothetical protein
MNKYDFETMIKDMEICSRHQEHLKKIKKKWMDESKKYKDNVVHMKEYQEETYKKKNKELVEKLKKKEKTLVLSLKNKEKTKLLERQKAIEIMMEKERMAKENVEKFLIKQENDRLQLEKDSNGKSN